MNELVSMQLKVIVDLLSERGNEIIKLIETAMPKKFKNNHNLKTRKTRIT